MEKPLFSFIYADYSGFFLLFILHIFCRKFTAKQLKTPDSKVLVKLPKTFPLGSADIVGPSFSALSVLYLHPDKTVGLPPGVLSFTQQLPCLRINGSVSVI